MNYKDWKIKENKIFYGSEIYKAPKGSNADTVQQLVDEYIQWATIKNDTQKKDVSVEKKQEEETDLKIQNRINAAIALTFDLCEKNVGTQFIEYWWEENSDIGREAESIIQIDLREKVILVSEKQIYNRVSWVLQSDDVQTIVSSIVKALKEIDLLLNLDDFAIDTMNELPTKIIDERSSYNDFNTNADGTFSKGLPWSNIDDIL